MCTTRGSITKGHTLNTQLQLADINSLGLLDTVGQRLVGVLEMSRSDAERHAGCCGNLFAVL